MKRLSHRLEMVADMNNLEAAANATLKGKERMPYAKRFQRMREKKLHALQQMILTLNFPPLVYEHGSVVTSDNKERDLGKKHLYPWMILDQAIINVLKKDLDKSFIYDNYASIKGRGTHFGARRLKMFLRRYKEYSHFVKTDYKKFFQSIPHTLILESLRHKYKDERFIELIKISQLSYDGEMYDELDAEIEKRETGHHNWVARKPISSSLVHQRDLPHIQGRIQG
jgi:hypothetical protein